MRESLLMVSSFALTLAGRRFSEEKLIGYAYAFEQATMFVRQSKQNMIIHSTVDLDGKWKEDRSNL